MLGRPNVAGSVSIVVPLIGFWRSGGGGIPFVDWEDIGGREEERGSRSRPKGD
jgi:hypothetical protein